jgi:hypothetical protein
MGSRSEQSNSSEDLRSNGSAGAERRLINMQGIPHELNVCRLMAAVRCSGRTTRNNMNDLRR